MEFERKKRRSATGVFAVFLIAMSLAGIAEANRTWVFQSKMISADTCSGQLGAEYDTIAKSIRSGRGFSDPFQEPSGATAWMPPLLPLLLAGLYTIFNDNRDIVRDIFVASQGPIVLFVGVAVLISSKIARINLVVPVCFLMGATADFYELFQRTHDTQPITVCITLLLIGIVSFWESPTSVWKSAAWGILGGVFALLSPITGFTWAAITTLRWLPKHSEMSLNSVKPLAIAAIFSMVTISPWIIRNYYHFGKFIPIKSNAVYEIWQSQCLDDDGVLDKESAFQHPWGSRSEQRIEYLEVGETEFLRKRWPPVFESIRRDPLDLLNRIANRCFAATVYYHAFAPWDEEQVWPMRYKRLYFALPFLSLVIILMFRRFPFPKELTAAIMIYLLYLGPYVLISYYDRYAAPLFGIKVILLVYGVDTVRQIIQTRKLNGGEVLSSRAIITRGVEA